MTVQPEIFPEILPSPSSLENPPRSEYGSELVHFMTEGIGHESRLYFLQNY